MKALRRVAFGLAALLALWLAALVAAAESGEVVTLRTHAADGRVAETRLWIADSDGSLFVRAGGPERHWLRDLRERPDVELVRGGTMISCRAVPIENDAIAQRVNQRFAEKYGVADRIVTFPRGAGGRVPVRLDPR